tara:strand:- start:56 stop:169 length:114 start_codon:yes stop_codon:yes gene_type:complete
MPRKKKKELKKKGWYITNEDFKSDLEDYVSTIRVPIN